MTIQQQTKWMNAPAGRVNVHKRFTRRIGRDMHDLRAQVANKLLPAQVETLEREPVKVLARDTTIAPETLKQRRRGTALLDGPGLLVVAMKRPDSPLATVMRAMLNGPAEAGSPQAINSLVALLNSNPQRMAELVAFFRGGQGIEQIEKLVRFFADDGGGG